MMKLFYQWSENPFVNRRNSTPNVMKKHYWQVLSFLLNPWKVDEIQPR
jgi:hypothetical protein